MSSHHGSCSHDKLTSVRCRSCCSMHGLTATLVFNIGALMIRIGFWGHYVILVIRSLQNSIGNYLGPIVQYARLDGHHSSRVQLSGSS